MTRQSNERPGPVEEPKDSPSVALEMHERIVRMYQDGMGKPFWDSASGQKRYKVKVEGQYFVYDPQTNEYWPEAPPKG